MIRPLIGSWALLALGLGLPLPALAQSRHEVNTEKARAEGKATEGPQLDRTEALITSFTNHFRKEKGRGKLTPNKYLADAADYFAHYLAGNDKFSHTADGQQPWERAARHGYEYCIVLENLAYRYNPSGPTTRGLARGFVQGWKDSPEHRKNLLDPDVTDTGVAVAHSEDTGRYYAVQMFGRPHSARIAFQIANHTGSSIAYRVAGKTFELRPRYTRTHEVCRPPRLDFLGAADEEGHEVLETVRPEDGEKLVVRKGDGGGYSVRKEEE